MHRVLACSIKPRRVALTQKCFYLKSLSLPTTHRLLASMAEASDISKPQAQQPLDEDTKQPECSKEEQPLPKLSSKDFAIYNQASEHMNYFHNNFRHTWTLLHNACTTNKRPQGMSIKSFLSTGLEFCHHLHMHHSIEEQHIFPVLATRMPAFKKELELLTQHKQIHNGMDKMEAYLESCRRGERELRLDELKELMDGFGDVLWQHLDQEVKELGAENMRKYWSLAEVRRLPM